MLIFSSYQRLVNLWSWPGTGPRTSTWKPSLWMLTCLAKAVINHLHSAGHGKQSSLWMHLFIQSFQSGQKEIGPASQTYLHPDSIPSLAYVWHLTFLSSHYQVYEEERQQKFMELLRRINEDSSVTHHAERVLAPSAYAADSTSAPALRWVWN